MILIPGISTSTSGRSIQTSMVTPQRFLANSIYTGVHTERQVQFSLCAFNRILRHYTIWAFLPLMPRCSKSIQIKSPTTIIQLWPIYAIVVIYLGNLTHITDKGFYAVSFGLRLMQWHEYYIFVLHREGLVSTSSKTCNNKLLHGYNSANLLLLLPNAQSIFKIQTDMRNTILSIRVLQGLMHTIRLEPLVDFRSTSKMTIRV